MFVHKYKVGDETFYRVSPQSKPGKTITLEVDAWKGKVSEKTVSQYIAKIESFIANPEEAPKEETPKKEKKVALHKVFSSIAHKMESF